MHICENGNYRDLTPEKEARFEQAKTKAEAVSWQTVSYEEAVNAEIRKRYSESAEFAILRQKDEKPEEYTAYYAYCEDCKAFVKEKMA